MTTAMSTTPDDANSLESRERSARLLWTGMIIAFFVVQAIVWAVAITLTSNDRSHVILPDYSENGRRWDEIQRQKAASKALGWKSRIQIDSKGDIRGNRKLTVFLRDRDGQPVDDAIVQVDGFHRAAARDVQRMSMTGNDAGDYVANIRIQKDGWWQFEGTAELDGQTFLINEKVYFKQRR